MALTPKQQARREKILGAVRSTIAAEGYESLNIRGIAAQSGVSPTTLYNLYTNKNQLILASLRDNIARVNPADSTNGSALTRLFESIDALAEGAVAQPRYTEAITRMLFAAQASDEIVQLLITDFVDLLQGLIEQALEDGSLPNCEDPARVARQVAGAFWSTILLWIKGVIPLSDLRDEAQQHVRAILL